MEEWFRSWFGPLYEELYSHRDPTEAADQVASLLFRTGKIDHPVLDAGCGAGRHLSCLREQGCRAVGVDLSRHLLSRAVSQRRGPVACADLRHPPFRAESFGLVASFFTVFGYLDTPSDDAALFASLAALVRRVVGSSRTCRIRRMCDPRWCRATNEPSKADAWCRSGPSWATRL